MAKMWAGRTDGATEKIADELNSSIKIDGRMFEEDITGSIAHAMMLAYKNIITVIMIINHFKTDFINAPFKNNNYSLRFNL